MSCGESVSKKVFQLVFRRCVRKDVHCAIENAQPVRCVVCVVIGVQETVVCVGQWSASAGRTWLCVVVGLDVSIRSRR